MNLTFTPDTGVHVVVITMNGETYDESTWAVSVLGWRVDGADVMPIVGVESSKNNSRNLISAHDYCEYAAKRICLMIEKAEGPRPEDEEPPTFGWVVRRVYRHER